MATVEKNSRRPSAKQHFRSQIGLLFPYKRKGGPIFFIDSGKIPGCGKDFFDALRFRAYSKKKISRSPGFFTIQLKYRETVSYRTIKADFSLAIASEVSGSRKNLFYGSVACDISWLVVVLYLLANLWGGVRIDTYFVFCYNLFLI